MFAITNWLSVSIVSVLEEATAYPFARTHTVLFWFFFVFVFLFCFFVCGFVLGEGWVGRVPYLLSLKYLRAYCLPENNYIRFILSFSIRRDHHI